MMGIAVAMKSFALGKGEQKEVGMRCLCDNFDEMFRYSFEGASIFGL